jgi:hypothetical protein
MEDTSILGDYMSDFWTGGNRTKAYASKYYNSGFSAGQKQMGPWVGRTMRPSNEQVVTFSYKDQATTSLATTSMPNDNAHDNWPTQSGYVAATTMYSNSLFCPDSLNDTNTTVENIPMLNEYTAIWSRALVLRTNYKVTFNAKSTNADPFTAFICFVPYGQTFPTGMLNIDRIVHSGSNAAWSTASYVGFSTQPQGQITLEFGKYLPDCYGNRVAYLNSMQQTSPGTHLPGGTPDFSQPFAGPATALTDSPNAVIKCIIGIIGWKNRNNTGDSVATGANVIIQADIVTKLYRSGLLQ